MGKVVLDEEIHNFRASVEAQRRERQPERANDQRAPLLAAPDGVGEGHSVGRCRAWRSNLSDRENRDAIFARFTVPRRAKRVVPRRIVNNGGRGLRAQE